MRLMKKEKKMKQIILTGDRPTGNLHVGHYVGSLKRRVELQNKMDTKLDVLRSLVDTAVSPEDRLISPGLHEVWSKELNEIGRMLGGWKKSNE